MKRRRKFSQHETALARFFVYIVVPGCLHSVYEIIIIERHSCAGRNLTRIIRYIFFYAVVGVVTNNHRLEIVSRSGLCSFASLRETLFFAFLFS